MFEDIHSKPMTMKRTLKYKGVPVLTYHIQYPKSNCHSTKQPAKRVNNFLFKKVDEFATHCEKELFEQAVKDYKQSAEKDYPFIVHEVDLTYHITYNKNYVLSLYFDRYLFTGGAHGTNKRISYTFDLKHQEKLRISDFFYGGTNYTDTILEEINNQIVQTLITTPGMYFEDYTTLTKDNFKAKNFYLTQEGFVIFYQEYEIAPYVTGLPTFTIPYHKSGPFPPTQAVR